MSKDLFKQAIAEAKSVREAAIANAKEALEESLTPHLKDMLAAKLQEMEDSKSEEIVDETVEEVEEAKDTKDEEKVEENLTEIPAVAEEEEAEEEEAEGEEDAIASDDLEAEPEAAEEPVEEPAGDEEISNLSVDQFKDMIRDIVSQEMGGGGEEAIPGMDDMDGGDIEAMGDEPEALEDPALDASDDEEEIDLDELLRELETESTEPVAEVADEKEEKIEETSELNEALETIQTLKKDLNEVNLLNSKLLYVNKIFKANDLSETQKVNIIAAFDKAETVKEVKLVFETVSDSVVSKKDASKTLKESKTKLGMASKAGGTTAAKPEIIAEVSDTVRRMQMLAGIIKQ